jgi:ethanolamine utilization protein EutQ (cupin superfamily)
MTVYSYRSNEVQFTESDKLPMTEVYLKDVVDSSSGSESMSAGLAKYSKGVSNSWTLDYDEFIVVISGVFTIHSEGNKSSTLKAGDFFFITRGTSVTYQADEASLLMYVTYPPWREAARKAGRL